MKNFTPGPWYVGMRNGRNPNTIFDRSGVDEHHDKSVCSVFGIPLHCSVEQLGERDAVGLANAHLISSAPDLYEALERLIEASHHSSEIEWLGQDEPWTVARAALAKARGEA